MNRLWLYCPDDENPLGVPGSTAKVVGRLLTERIDQKDAPDVYNYNFYMIGVNGWTGEPKERYYALIGAKKRASSETAV